MSVYIDTSGINVNTPVAFVNNDSQPIRDNWAAIAKQLNNANSAIAALNANFGLVVDLINSISGYSGFSGFSGYSGISGASGYSGQAGTSVKIIGSVTTASLIPGYPNGPYAGSIGDGYIAQDTGHLWIWTGTLWQDVGGIVGPTGASGISGFSGSGISGFSGYSGFSGAVGTSGYSGQDGTSIKILGSIPTASAGYFNVIDPHPTLGDGVIASDTGDLWVYTGTGPIVGFTDVGTVRGPTGLSGFSGFSGFSGYSGRSGYSGLSGYSGITPTTITVQNTANNSTYYPVFVQGTGSQSPYIETSQFTFNPSTADMGLGGSITFTNSSNNGIALPGGVAAYTEAVTNGPGDFVIQTYDSTNYHYSYFLKNGGLSIAGVIQSVTGGFEFPDNTTQTTAGSWNFNAAVDHVSNPRVDSHGYAKLPNGMIIQWGEGQAGENLNWTINFPTTFPNACLAVNVNERNASGWGDLGGGNYGITVYGASNFTASNFQVYCVVNANGRNTIPVGPCAFSYIAVGY